MNQHFTAETMGISFAIYMHTPAGKEKVASCHFERPCVVVAQALNELTKSGLIRNRDHVITALRRKTVTVDQAATQLAETAAQ